MIRQYLFKYKKVHRIVVCNLFFKYSHIITTGKPEQNEKIDGLHIIALRQDNNICNALHL